MSEQDINETITHFWNTYEAEGVDAALNEARARSENDDLKNIEDAVPALVEEARNRNIDILQFLGELDEARANEQVDAVEAQEDNSGEEDASGTDNGSSGVSADSSDEASEPQAEDESSSARDADGEDRS